MDRFLKMSPPGIQPSTTRSVVLAAVIGKLERWRDQDTDLPSNSTLDDPSANAAGIFHPDVVRGGMISKQIE